MSRDDPGLGSEYAIPQQPESPESDQLARRMQLQHVVSTVAEGASMV